MTREPLPPPDPADLPNTPLHVVVRDWPETLEVLRAAGVDVAAAGGLPLGRLPEAGPRIRACLEATAWRART